MPDMRELGVVRIARPCPARWSTMEGDDKVRFCGLCGLDVYNLSALTADEARALMREREGGRLCVRFWTRSDGTVMTRDCPRRTFETARATPGGLLVVAAAIVLWVVSLFAMNVRRLYAMTGVMVMEPRK